MITVNLREPAKTSVQLKELLQVFDPSVPAWARNPEKPEYTAEEVGAVSEDKLQESVETALSQAKESGEFDGEPGTGVTIESVSESSEDGGDNTVLFSDGKTLTVKNGRKGNSGVYIGAGDMPDGYNVQIDPDGDTLSKEDFVDVAQGDAIYGKLSEGTGLKTICYGWWYDINNTSGQAISGDSATTGKAAASVVCPLKVTGYPVIVEVDNGYFVGASKFDANGNFIDGISSSQRRRFELTDEQCKYLGVFVRKDGVTDLSGVPITAEECGLVMENATPAQFTADIGKALYDVQWGFGYISKGNYPKVLDSVNCIYSDFIDVSGYDSFSISCPSDFWFRVFLFGEDQTLIGTFPAKQSSTTIVTGDNIKYIRLNLEIYETTGEQIPLNSRYLFKASSYVYMESGNANNETHVTDIKTKYAEDMKIALAARRKYNDNDAQLPTFIHVTDIHGDGGRFANACEIAEFMQATAVLNTGDTAENYGDDDVSFIEQAVTANDLTYLVCLGNHDTARYADDLVYDKYIAPFAVAQGYTMDTNVEKPTYFYKDFADQKLRVLSINQFQNNTSTGATTNMHFTQEQIDFIAASLLSTPADYGVVIIMHTPEKKPVVSNGYEKFFGEDSGWFETGLNISPIAEIVDAFISGTSINKTYNNKTGTTPASFTVNADFSAKNSGVEFICYITGHLHRDCIHYVPNTTNKQLVLNETCTGLTSEGNLPRVYGTSTEDAFNVYCIDRINKSVKVVRIGSNMPCDLSTKRDYMVIPYAE